MAHLIIGETTHDSVRLWVGGDERHRRCEVTLTPAAPTPPPVLELDSARDHTGVVVVSGLAPDTAYRVVASFGGVSAHGRFRTFQEPGGRHPPEFSFVLSSCNLSVVTVNNFLAMLLAVFGTSLGRSSLFLPFSRWRWPRAVWLKRLLRRLLNAALRLTALGITGATELKQPGVPYLRSPFLKLAAVFDGYLVEIETEEEVTPSSQAKPAPTAPAVGTTVFTSPEYPATVACAARLLSINDRTRRFRFVVTQCDRPLVVGSRLSRIVIDSKTGAPSATAPVGVVVRCVAARPWHERPSFFMHAGDQIYFDIPKPKRIPDLEEYRLAYREAWFDDPANRYLLSHWPHYMTLDDHEIADQFSRDFHPPAPGATVEQYAGAALQAYREYAGALVKRGDDDTLWYAFAKGQAAFFVLDTRTARFDKKSRIIDDDQLTRLLAWMDEHPSHVKFVVTSVPFVAEINEEETRAVLRWDDPETSSYEKRQATVANPEHDKWSAKRFRAQRERIIEHIARQRIEPVVFLTGDMHCCYHASMRISGRASRSEGENLRYRAVTVHELAGGPVNQLQLGNHKEFSRRCCRTTEGGISYEVDLERFHGDVSAVMHIRVSYEEHEFSAGATPHLVPVVEWNVIRTLTDTGPDAWRPAAFEPVAALPPEDGVQEHEPVMSGRIRFVFSREQEELPRWERQGLWRTEVTQ